MVSLYVLAVVVGISPQVAVATVRMAAKICAEGAGGFKNGKNRGGGGNNGNVIDQVLVVAALR